MYHLNKIIYTVCMFVSLVLVAGAVYVPVRASSPARVYIGHIDMYKPLHTVM